jgi:alcohol dehydrogenase class IV
LDVSRPGSGSCFRFSTILAEDAHDLRVHLDFTDRILRFRLKELGWLNPTVAIVDYELTFTMPASLTAAVGVDTLTHAIEAYVSKRASALTDPIALFCAHVVSKYLRIAWSDPQDRAAREGMSAAACQGGMAFSNSSVCLVHGMSRPIGAVFHVPHGLSNAVLLPTGEITTLYQSGY